MTGQQLLILLIRWLFAALALLAVLVYLIWPLVRAWRRKIDPTELMPTFDLPLEEEELQPPEQAAKPDRHTIVELARANPRQTAMLVSRWLREKR